MAQHDQLREDTNLDIYFCYPQTMGSAAWNRLRTPTVILPISISPKVTDQQTHTTRSDAVAARDALAPGENVLDWKTAAETFNEHATTLSGGHKPGCDDRLELWSEYASIAKFFTETAWSAQGDAYGLVELPMRNNQGWNGFMTRAAGYAKAPTDPGFFFDPETMNARINNPGFVRALEDWDAVIQYGPPGMLNFGWIENALSFVGGIAAQDIQWGDIGPMSKDPEASVVEGAVGYGIAPGADEYWDPAAGQWVAGSGPNKAPFLGFGGWFNLVPNTSNNLAAAFDLASFLGSPEVLGEAAVTAGTGVNPGTTATLEPSL